MDFGDPWTLLSGMLIGTIGVGLFMYGKRQGNLPCLLAGVALNVFPFVIHSLLILWALTGACLAGLYAVAREG